MIHTHNQWYEKLWSWISSRIEKMLEEKRCYNAALFADGKVVSVSGNRATVTINAATSPTPGVGVPQHVTGLVPGAEVVVLCRTPRDMTIMFVKPL
ncbi:hypothetical protein [Tumebacillus flagellatus]|uniref:Uncharacterized protein n=1 Tax=Tumebacillus flagellatus TaxID=1157490 RepID=A0A074LK53_9BACL|nr:hypothetical protein [Tumebacillus flagellatus]KEO81484.1 hypothetical protein EL26_20645 [Tumebacillus flagellatus]